MAPAQLFQAFLQAVADDGTTVILLLAIFLSGVRKFWVLGRELTRAEAQLTDERLKHIEEIREIKSDRDSWQRMALARSDHPSVETRPPAAEGDD